MKTIHILFSKDKEDIEMDKLKNLFLQLISYFFVGGIAAIVEWLCFYLFANVWHIFYLYATCLAFLFSTSVNYLLGRVWTFKNNESYHEKRVEEVLKVFGVSAIGLLFNVILMYLFVGLLKMDTAFLNSVSKILATGLVFIWNFLARRFWVYK